MSDMNVRAGSELRKRASKIIHSKTARYVCPRTGKAVKRVSNSIWESTGGYIFAGGTYALTTPSGEVLERMLREYKEAAKKR
ncbi:MAG: 50S ribosomal protein L37ae [Candidatus Micrarchaeota archaeon]